ncbi:MAG: hypothetical protein JJU29_15065 [Verrucomicrobia bacterium]|nr:hypothetical protein [Verrucomicrobiota bacterium]MCH8513160.1 hypothetical protein [Kiritimatiellia bacterium]
MKTKVGIKLLFIGLMGMTSFVGAQRGIGDAEGLARQQTPVTRNTVAGEVIEVKLAPCEQTTGPSDIGMHYFLKTGEDLILNLHLGPDHAVKALGLPMEAGFPLTARVFRTEKMAKNHWVVQEVTIEGSRTRLREENLRPVWADPFGTPVSPAWEVKEAHKLAGYALANSRAVHFPISDL